MSSKIGLNLTKNYSINFSTPKRRKKQIKFIIIHYTGMKKESQSIKRLCDVKSKVSSHYFIKNNGEILNLVPDLYEAWHAGKSSWKKFNSLNKFSLGIELNNTGHDNKYENFKVNENLIPEIIVISNSKKNEDLKINISKYKLKEVLKNFNYTILVKEN